MQRRGLLWVGGGEAGGKQPIEFLFVECAIEPSQEKMCGPRQRDLAERNPQRKLEERRGAGVAEKRALDFAAARACCLCDYQQTNVGVRGELATAPDRASG